jgi:hypothetical protein
MSIQGDFCRLSMSRFSKSIVCRLVALVAALHFAIAPALAMSQCGCGDCECASQAADVCCCGRPAQHKAAAKSCCGKHGPLAQQKADAPHKSCCQAAPATCETAEGCSCQPAPAAEQNAVASRTVDKKLQKEAPVVSFVNEAGEHAPAHSVKVLPSLDRQASPAVARHALLCVWRN